MFPQEKKIFVFCPTISILLYLGICHRGTIYYIDPAGNLSKLVLNKLLFFLKLLNIRQLTYGIGIGELGNGMISKVRRKSMDLTEEFYHICIDKKLIEKFNSQFKTKLFSIDWKRNVGEEIYEILLSCHGIVSNYPTPATVYTSPNTISAFTVNKFNAEFPNTKLAIKYFRNSTNILLLAGYFVLLTKKIFSNGFCIKPIKEKHIATVMTESVRPLNETSFNPLEWWDKEKIKKREILFYSVSDAEMGRVGSFHQARELGFYCAKINQYRKIPARQIRKIVQIYFVFLFKNSLLIIKSKNLLFYLTFLLKCFEWNLFFLYYEVKNLVASDFLLQRNLTIICNYFGCTTTLYHLSYIGCFGHPITGYSSANNMVFWGKAQLFQIEDYCYVGKKYFSGCHGLSYIDGQREKILENLSRISRHYNIRKKNIVFFDNAMTKDGSNPEVVYLKYLELIIHCAELLDANVLFRQKKKIKVEQFDDKGRYALIKKRFEGLDICMLSSEDYDVISVISMADVVVYSMVGTPSMLALMFDIPALSFYDCIEETPDPIMKHYLNELIFEDQGKLIVKIEKILNEEEIPLLRLEDKKRLNHYLDNKGLTRLQSIVADIVNDKEPPYPAKKSGMMTKETRN